MRAGDTDSDFHGRPLGEEVQPAQWGENEIINQISKFGFKFLFHKGERAIFGAHVFAPQKLRSEPRGVKNLI